MPNNYLNSFNDNDNIDSMEEKLNQNNCVNSRNAQMYKTNRYNRNVVIVFIMVVILIGLTVACFITLGNSGKVIPDLTGYTKNNALLWASENKVNIQFQEEFSDSYDEDIVISQSIASGEKLTKDKVIIVTISKGVDLAVTVQIPDFKSMTKTEIEEWGNINKMAALRITSEYSETVVTSRVIRYEINDDSVVDSIRRDTPIYVVISKGIEKDGDTLITIPNFKTMQLYEITNFAQANGLKITIKEEYNDYTPEGILLSQSVKEKEKVPKNTEIIIIVSKGKKVLVPDLSSCSKDNIISVATNAGVNVIIKERYSSSDVGRMISQSIKAGEIYNQGDIIEVYFSLGDEIHIPSYTGSSLATIQEYINNLNESRAKLELEITYSQSDQPKNTIINQDKAGIIIKRGTTIKLVVSSGNKIFVPNFVSPINSSYVDIMTREKAQNICNQLGMTPIFIEEKSENRLPGEIWYQSIAANTEVMSGDTITLKYAPANVEVTVGSYIGLTKDEILLKAELNLLKVVFEMLNDNVEGYTDVCSSQSISINTKVIAGTEIVIYISPSPSPLTSDTAS